MQTCLFLVEFLQLRCGCVHCRALVVVVCSPFRYKEQETLLEGSFVGKVLKVLVDPYFHKVEHTQPRGDHLDLVVLVKLGLGHVEGRLLIVSGDDSIQNLQRLHERAVREQECLDVIRVCTQVNYFYYYYYFYRDICSR